METENIQNQKPPTQEDSSIENVDTVATLDLKPENISPSESVVHLEAEQEYHQESQEKDTSINDTTEESDDKPSSTPQSIDNTITLLRDQIDTLQIKFAERGKHWSREPSLIISVLALSISVVFSIIGLRQTFAEDIEGKQETLRQTVVELTEIQSEMAQIAQQYSGNPLLYREANVNLNTRRAVLLDTAETLVEELGDSVDPSTLLSLAWQFQIDGRLEETREFANKAFDLSKSVLLQSAALKGIGSSYMTTGSPIHDLEQGRDALRRSTELFESRDNDLDRFNLADNLLYWANLERMNGEEQMADDLLEQATNAAKGINILHPGRQTILMQIQQAQNNQISQDFLDPRGEWQLTFANDSSKKGRVLIRFEQQSQGYFINMQVFSNGKLLENRTGSAAFLGSGKIIFQWQGIRYNEQSQTPLPSSGASILDVLPDSEELQGTDSAVGDEEENIILKRISP
ncbi:MAG: hypothetical protein KDJ65_05230 [Anaerolineae bacterium]|nr:hypothetical protein [Anaerolineae bacterium]